MSLATEKKLDHLHWPLVLCTILICTLGVWNLASATKSALNPMWIAQSKWMFLGALAVGAFLFIDYRFLATAAWPIYFASLALLAVVAFHGKKVLGARRWLQLGPMQLQPSEFVKLALIVLMARFFSRDDVSARKGQYGLLDLWRPFLFVLIPVALVMKQPDLGTALVTFSIAMTMIVFAKVQWQSLTALFAGGIAAAVFAWERLLKPYQKSRIGSFLAIGIAALFFWHAFINIGMVTGMMPVVGVPLPLFSYGGSSVLADLLGVGILLNVSLRRFMF